MIFKFEPSRSLNPLPIVVEALDICSAKGQKALDVGFGSGRNAVYLAQHGFQIDAIDCSRIAIDELDKYVKKDRLPIQLIRQDICCFTPAFHMYELVLFTEV